MLAMWLSPGWDLEAKVRRTSKEEGAKAPLQLLKLQAAVLDHGKTS